MIELKGIINEEIEGFVVEMAGKQWDWVTQQKPKVIAALNQIDAPRDWKQKVMRLEKISTNAHNNLWRMSWQRVVQTYGSEMGELMKELGNPSDEYQPYGKGYEHPYYQYWKQYSDLMGFVEDANVGDWLA